MIAALPMYDLPPLQQANDRLWTAIREALASEGRLVLYLTDGAWMKTGYEPRSWEWIDQDHFVTFFACVLQSFECGCNPRRLVEHRYDHRDLYHFRKCWG